MPKYCVSMNYTIAYATKFIIDCEDEDTVYDVIGSMDSDFLEENLSWGCCEYAEPIVDDIKLVKVDDPNLSQLSKKFLDKFQEIKEELIDETN